MVEFIPDGTTFDFLKYRRTAALISLVVIAIGIGVMAVRGLGLGIDFAGGTLMHVRFAEETTTEAVRAALTGTALADGEIQKMGGRGDEFFMRGPLSPDGNQAVTREVTASLAKTFGEGVEILRAESVGPAVGEVLRQRAILAIVFATLMMGVYIWARFEWRFGLGAGVSLLHDVLIAVAALAAFGYELDLSIVAALLSIVGYSVNDTVVISDRIRENMAKDRRSNMYDLINLSLNETLSRTILTTGVTLLVVIALFLLGGPVINGFAFALLIGFIAGTYSTVFIATAVVLFFEEMYPSAGRKAA